MALSYPKVEGTSGHAGFLASGVSVDAEPFRGCFAIQNIRSFGEDPEQSSSLGYSDAADSSGLCGIIYTLIGNKPSSPACNSTYTNYP